MHLEGATIACVLLEAPEAFSWLVSGPMLVAWKVLLATYLETDLVHEDSRQVKLGAPKSCSTCEAAETSPTYRDGEWFVDSSWPHASEMLARSVQ